MKRFVALFSLIIGVGHLASGAMNEPWVNDGAIDEAPDINSPVFFNSGTMAFNTGDLYYGVVSTPFKTLNTRWYTNTGTMVSSVGFQFSTFTNGKETPALSFYNDGLIQGIDGPSFLNYSRPVNGKNIPMKGAATATPSYVLVSANAVTNRGTFAVGGVGLLGIKGTNVDLAYSVQTAGEPLAYSKTDGQNMGYTAGDWSRGFVLSNLFVNPIGVRDIVWGVQTKNTDLASLVVSLVDPLTDTWRVSTPDVMSRTRVNYAQGRYTLDTFRNTATNAITYPYYKPYVYTAAGPETNIYINIVLINTNFADPSVIHEVLFTEPTGIQTGQDEWPMEAMVKFGVPYYDILTSHWNTNAFYFLDRGAAMSGLANLVNYETANDYGRPNCFEITTGTPGEWDFASPTNSALTNGIIWPGAKYTQQKVDIQCALYGAQVGRNPEIHDGTTLGTNNTYGYSRGYTMYKDPTNEPCRVEVDAANLNVDSTKFRSEGMVKLSGKNVSGLNEMLIDSGIVSVDLGVPKGSIMLSNVIPSHFNRCRGDIFAWSGTWTCVETNQFQTNNWHFHMLVIDHNLKGDFKPSTPSVALRSPKVEVHDALNMSSQCLFQTEDLLLNSDVTLNGKLLTFGSANIPNLKNLVLETNAFLTAERQLNIGADRAGVNKVVNRGVIGSLLPTIKSTYLENSGIIASPAAMIANAEAQPIIGGGNLSLQASTMVFKADPEAFSTKPLYLAYGRTNHLISVGGIQIVAGSLRATGSSIESGLSGRGILDVTVSDELTDCVPGVPGTNNVITNVWTTTAGFTFKKKPALGDLFGTKIVALASSVVPATHIWPGTDCGPSVDGFTNNMVIGHLVLDRVTPNSSIVLKGAGARNAMYVDYLEFADYSTNLDSRIRIDNNLTIYYADSNLPESKIPYARMIWVPEFSGPNSSTNVAVQIDGITTNCMFNRLLRTSSRNSDLDDAVNKDDSFPFDGTVLRLNVSGNGTVSPNLDMRSLMIGSNYTFTATAAAGYWFAGWSWGEMSSMSSKITVKMTPDLVLNAVFLPNYLPQVKGTYSGLFMPENDPAQATLDNAGVFSLSVTEQGTCSGTFGTTRFTGLVDKRGNGTATIKRLNDVLALSFKLATNGEDCVTGTVASSVKGVCRWSSDILGYRSTYNSNNRPPVSGLFTLSLQGNGDGSRYPAGSGYATVSIANTGVATFTGRLADDVAYTATATVAKNGAVPLSLLKDGKELVIGWLYFDTNSSPVSVDGNLAWVKAANYGATYKSGFTNVVEATGSAYVPTAKTQSPIQLQVPVFKADSSVLATPISCQATAKGAVYSNSSYKLTLEIVPAKGNFSGKFVTEGKTYVIYGVVLQKWNNATGYFIGSGKSGRVALVEGENSN